MLKENQSARSISVLDAPVGTGRFVHVYGKLPHWKVEGIDFSEDMLDQAYKKLRNQSGANVNLQVGDVTSMPQFKDGKFEVALCIRLLHLIDPLMVTKVLKELTRVTKSTLILTIQLGDAYHAGSDVATHDGRLFRALVKRLGWTVEREEVITGKGWHIMKLVK
jgi:ubiquinone/menaquinone biosynthesis C-methylase UbiE